MILFPRTARVDSLLSALQRKRWGRLSGPARRTITTSGNPIYESAYPQKIRTDGCAVPKVARQRKRIVVAVTGATGAPLAVTLLQVLRALNFETQLILSTWGSTTLKYELDEPNNSARYLQSLADDSYSPKDVSASLFSGSFRSNGMIVVPCSMKTLAGIRMGYDNDLITRAASVTLKERRRLVLGARKTPLSSIHLENMLEVTRAGAVVFPPVMAFYTRPKSIHEMVTQSVRRMIDLLDLDIEEHEACEGRWEGFDWEKRSNIEPEHSLPIDATVSC